MSEIDDLYTVLGYGAITTLNNVLESSVGSLMQRLVIGDALHPTELTSAYAVLDGIVFASTKIPQTAALADMRMQFLASLRSYRAVLDAFAAGDVACLEAEVAEFCEAETLLIILSQRLARQLGQE